MKTWLVSIVSLCVLLFGNPIVLAQLNYEPYAFATFAGNAGYGTTDGSGNSARFWYPSGAAVDSAGNVYVADFENCTIRKITPAGVASTFCGSPNRSGSADGVGRYARFLLPADVAIDSSGNLYVADSGNYTIRKITPDRRVSTLAGSPGIAGVADGLGSAARFGNLQGVAVDGTGNVYVADTFSHTIRKITANGMVSTLAGRAGVYGAVDGVGDAALFYRPWDVATDNAGNIFVADSYNNRIRTVTPAGVVTTFAGSSLNGSADGVGPAAQFWNPRGVAVDGGGNVFVADSANYTIRKITPDAIVSTFAGLAGNWGSADGIGNAAQFAYPQGVATDNNGIVYVGDTQNHIVRRITPAAAVTTLAGLAGGIGSADGSGSQARFNWPYLMSVDHAGNIYVADLMNHLIRKVTRDGVVTTLAGLAGSPGSNDGTGSGARFRFPRGTAVDNAGNVYVTDSSNSTIRKITPAGVVTTLAGLAGSSGSADGVGNAARFNDPGGIATDEAGNIYVTDSGNETVRKITPSGVVSTIAGSAGTSGSNDGVGSSARFHTPLGITLDGAGNIYVADLRNNSIRKITPTGVVTTLAGLSRYLNGGYADGTGSAARFDEPGSVATDASGNVYVADTHNGLIRRITPAGATSTLAGTIGLGNENGIGTAVLFDTPYGIAVDGDKIYVADTFNHEIRVGRPTNFNTGVRPLGAASRKSHGNAGRFSIDLPLAPALGIECRSGGQSGEYEVVVKFAQPITFDYADVVGGGGNVSETTVNRQNISRGQDSTAGTSAADQVTVNVAGVTNAQTVTIALFNVSDGSDSGDVGIRMGVMVGDTSGNGKVNASDIAQIKSQASQTVTSSNFREDITTNGMIDASDVSLGKLNSGTALP